MIQQHFSSFSMPRGHLEDLLKYGSLGPTRRVSDSGYLGLGLSICISNRLPGDVHAAGAGTILGEPLLHQTFHICPYTESSQPAFKVDFAASCQYIPMALRHSGLK